MGNLHSSDALVGKSYCSPLCISNSIKQCVYAIILDAQGNGPCLLKNIVFSLYNDVDLDKNPFQDKYTQLPNKPLLSM